jgi:hypothetical protein
VNRALCFSGSAASVVMAEEQTYYGSTVLKYQGTVVGGRRVSQSRPPAEKATRRLAWRRAWWRAKSETEAERTTAKWTGRDLST